ncbi:hypothetical protein BH10BAC3_BH10BAC3_05100 [soil metagenome]
MLAGNFYTSDKFHHEAGVITATIIFNGTHPIFEGHFPSIPVVPGVCMMQLVKEILEQAISKKTRITKANQLKFLSLITPTITTEVDLKLQYTNDGNTYDVNAELRNTERSFFKMKAILLIA